MIPAPSNKKGHAQFRPFPIKSQTRSPTLPSKKGRHEADPFQSRIYAVFAAQFNYRI